MTSRKYASLIAYLVLVVTAVALVWYANRAESAVPQQYEVYTVRSGDTLSDIAKKYHPDKDWREVVYEIEQVNGITPMIFPGQRIKVPVE